MLAALVAIASAVGILVPSIYAKETASWAAQGVGQDVVDLAIIAPALLVCARGVARGSRRALVVLAGVLVYVAYSYVLYALAMHFNSLFLVYCAALGVAVYTLAGVGLYLSAHLHERWFAPTPRRARAVGGYLIVLATLFALLWLSSIIPALVTGVEPPALAEAGLVTNPVHVLDLALALPALLISGALLVRQRPAGLLLAPVMLAFDVAMSLAILGMNIAMAARGVAMEPVVATVMALVALASAWMLVGYARTLSRS